jgi:hypothetical protein
VWARAGAVRLDGEFQLWISNPCFCWRTIDKHSSGGQRQRVCHVSGPRPVTCLLFFCPNCCKESALGFTFIFMSEGTILPKSSVFDWNLAC